MKQFSVISLLAAMAAAEYQSWALNENGAMKDLWVRSQDFSSASAIGTQMTLQNNNNVFVQSEALDGMDYSYKPNLRGGSIQYDVFLAWHDCGCVSSIYLVDTENPSCDQDAKQDGAPSTCAKFDVMQANNYGFNVGANPCANGECDPLSQCMYDMREEGAAEYGSAAYGPGGTLINSYSTFNVKTEFMSMPDYSSLWGLRTTITQGENEIVMQKDCRGYIEDLDMAIEGNMQMVFSTWDNKISNAIDIENDQCPNSSHSCDYAYSIFSNVQIKTDGSNEDPDGVDPEPEPEDPDTWVAEWVNFVAGTDQAGYDPEWEMWMIGLDSRNLTAWDRTVEMGFDNRAFVLDYMNNDDTYWAYWHDLLGGSFEYEVSLANTQCACAAGVFMVDLDNEACSWDAKDEGVTPQCPTIEIMEANQNSFNSSSNGCEFGVCDPTDTCNADPNSSSPNNYGPSSNYLINSQQEYKVRTEFWANEDEYGNATELFEIRTVLMQGENTVVMVQDCPQIMNGNLGYSLMNNMNVGISMYSIDADDSCTEVCDTMSTNFKMSNLQWSSMDSIVPYEPPTPPSPGEPVWGGAAPYLDSGNCEGDCTECREFWYENYPEDWTYECYSFDEFRFGGGCGGNKDRTACMTDDIYCINSWDLNDDLKWKSPDARCRTVPYAYRNYSESELMKAKNPQRNQTNGLCKAGCDVGSTCYQSWPLSDPLKSKGMYALARCFEDA